MAGFLFIAYALAIAALMIFEKQLIFFPSTYPAGDWPANQASADQDSLQTVFEDCFFQAQDGTKLHGWFCTPGSGRRSGPSDAHLTILWFHGNAGNISHRRMMIDALLQLPADIFIFDYRGYGKSSGSPSEQGIYLDARAAWDFLVQNRRIPPSRIVLFGKSLGSAPAIELATRIEPAGLIIQSAFTSIPDMASVYFPFIPGFLIRTQMNSLARVGGIQCAKLFIHSKADEIVPYSMGMRLFEAASQPKAFCEVPQAHHNDTWLIGGIAYMDCIRRFLASLSAGKKK
jgi:fermentation-respiration switch protein FrsA (DUF1100 family)